MKKDSVIVKIKNKWYEFTEPFECSCCRKKISIQQFRFSMLCGYCDLGKCFSGGSGYPIGHGRKTSDFAKEKGKPHLKLNILENLK